MVDDMRVPEDMLTEEERWDLERKIRAERVRCAEAERRKKEDEGMTLREIMARSAEQTTQYLQARRDMPANSIATTTSVPGDDDSEGFIFPRAGQGMHGDFPSVKPHQCKITPRSQKSKPETGGLDAKQKGVPANHDGICSHCGWQGTRYRCSRCKVIRYCSAACQKKHWESHKLLCQAIQKAQ